MRYLFLFLWTILSTTSGQAQQVWQKADPIAARLATCTIAVSSDGTVFVGGLDGNLYSSDNDGESWQRMEVGKRVNGPIQSLELTSEGYLFAMLDDGTILRSLDGGNRWSPIQFDWLGSSPKTATLHYDSESLFVSRHLSLTHSTDLGETWSELAASPFGSGETITKISSSPKKDIFVGTASGSVFKFGSVGRAWARRQVADSPIRAFAFTAEGDVFCGTFGSGVYKSSDSGESWHPAEHGLSNPYVLSLCADREDALLAGVSGGGIFRSSDGGETWTGLHSEPRAHGVWDLTVGPTGDVFAATDAGVLRYSAQDEQWAATGLVEAQIRALARSADDAIFAGTFGGGILRSNDDGESWTEVNTGLTPVNVLSLLATPNGDVFAGTAFGGIYYSVDSGESWNNVSPLSPIRPAVYQTIGALAMDSSGVLYAGTKDFLGTNTLAGIYYSPNNGQNWVASAFSNDVSTIAVDDSGFVHTGQDRSRVWRKTYPHPDSLWAPYWWRDRANWSSPAQPVIPLNVFGIAFGQSQIYVASFDDGLFRLSDTTWTKINNGVIDTLALSITNKDGSLFAGTFGGSIYRSDDEGDNWVLSNPGMTDKAVTSLLVTSFGRILAGTNGNGIFRSSVITSVRSPGGSPPQTFILSQNYPNPFNPQTTIRYQIEQRSRVRLVIFNLLGQRIRTLVDEERTAATHSVIWDGLNDWGRPVASGVYVYRLEAGAKTASRKLLIMR